MVIDDYPILFHRLQMALDTEMQTPQDIKDSSKCFYIRLQGLVWIDVKYILHTSSTDSLLGWRQPTLNILDLFHMEHNRPAVPRFQLSHYRIAGIGVNDSAIEIVWRFFHRRKIQPGYYSVPMLHDRCGIYYKLMMLTLTMM